MKPIRRQHNDSVKAKPARESTHKSFAERFVSAISIKSLIEGVSDYRSAFSQVWSQRGQYGALTIEPQGDSALHAGLSTFLYGTAISFVLYAPIILWHHLSMEKYLFLLEWVYVQLLIACLAQLSARVFGGRATFRQTAGAYCTWSGFVLPVSVVLFYPLLLYEPIKDFLVTPNAYGTVSSSDVPVLVSFWSLIVTVVLITIGLVIPVRWLADLHRMTRARFMTSCLVVGVPILALHQRFLAPLVQEGFRALNKVLGLL